MSPAEAFGDRLAQERREKAARERRDITQRDVAKAVGLTSAAISKYEAGENIPNDAILAKIGAFYGVRPSWLRYGEGEKYEATATVEVVAGPAPRRSRVAESPTARRKGAR